LADGDVDKSDPDIHQRRDKEHFGEMESGGALRLERGLSGCASWDKGAQEREL